jgi:putative lipoprotein (rSAM/lipoprotein system)
MKKLNRSILRKINYCIGLILPLFGVACNVLVPEYGVPEPLDPFEDAYGVPYAEFQISGRVENSQKQAIKGIEVSIKQTNNPYKQTPLAKDTTDADGSFEFSFTEFPVNELLITTLDIDSTENGSYQSNSIQITPEYKDDPNNGWHSSTEINDIVITLEEEKK